jgi:hypothetical protein
MNQPGGVTNGAFWYEMLHMFGATTTIASAYPDVYPRPRLPSAWPPECPRSRCLLTAYWLVPG